MFKSRRITASLAMLLISAVLLSTASYAWFAMNTQTKAEGLEVEAYTDSLFLEISDGDVDDENNKIYDVEIDYAMATNTDLRLVTASLFKTLTYATVSAPQRLNEGYCTDTNAVYYEESEGNYIRVTDLVATSSTAGLYKNPTFTIVASNAKVTGTYYQYDTTTHTYTAVEINNSSAYGLYAMNGSKEGAGSTYLPTSTEGNVVVSNRYYEETTVDGKTVLTEVSASLKLGTPLTGLYTIETITEYLPTDTAANGATYFVKNGDDLTLVGAIPGGTVFGEHLFWGRAYSTLADNVQGNNTLTLVGAAEANDYYLTKTLYLRCAEGTNNATNLVVDDIVVGGAINALTPALRVLLVATSSTDANSPKRISACLYDAGADTYTYSNGRNNFFDTVLGNEAEEIEVQVYIYFDGTDEVAKNDVVAGALLNGQSIEIYFGINELPYNE